jgi:hypothetical protein
MVHTAVPGVACATCHAIGKTDVGVPATVTPPGNHVPFGTVACEKCHLSTSTATGGFKFANVSGTAPSSMVHSAVPGVACAVCHATGKSWAGTPATMLPPSNHVPFGAAACEGCHLASSTATGGFKFTNKTGTAPAAMVHSLVSAIVCSTCHEKGKTDVGVPATVVRPIYEVGNSGTLHVVAGECSSCHLNTVSFLGAVNYPPNHIPLPKGSASTCSICHTTGNYSTAVMLAPGHAVVTGTACAVCHAYGKSFAGTIQPKQPPAGSTGHIPSNPPNGTGNFACESCHSPSVFTSFAGTIMKHAVTKSMQCQACHERGMTWKVNPTGTKFPNQIWYRDVRSDHNGKGAAPNDCSNCHNSKDKHALRRALASARLRAATVAGAGAGSGAASGSAATFNHVRVANLACASCHNQVNATGKPADHLAVVDNCASCHTTLAWVPVSRVDHTQVKGSCVSCHNKIAAKGKGNAHIASGDNCETCHTTVAWTPARFDHAAVASHTCVDCHNGLRATGLPVNHIPTRAAQCDTCHGTLGWKPAKLDHSTLTANCVSCHDNKIALGVTAGHMTLQRDCATCHSYPDWAALHFKHSTGKYPGEHKLALACTSCHTSNTEQIPWLAAGEAGSCAGCHTKDFKADSHPKTTGGLKYTASELHECSGACHVYSDATGSTVVKSLPGPYHRVSDATFKH